MDKVRVLIGVPTLNGPERLSRCLQSIASYTDFNYYDVKTLIADDGSTEANLKLNKDAISRSLQTIPGIQMLYGHGRTGIAATWNRLVRHYGNTFDVAILVNDDIQVVADWMDVLAYSAIEN